MDTQIAALLAQFGAAGLMGWMWLAERRTAALRDKQLSDLHDRLMQERTNAAALFSVLADNTRALTALEVGQRDVAAAIERLTGSLAIVGRGEIVGRASRPPPESPVGRASRPSSESSVVRASRPPSDPKTPQH